MKKRLAELLVCPVDRGALTLDAWESTHVPLTDAQAAQAAELGASRESLETRVVTGVLVNARKKLLYAIQGGVPRMTVCTNAAVAEFFRVHAERLANAYPGYVAPTDRASPGEEDVLRSFSAEWTGYDWDGEVYWNLPVKTMFDCMEFMLDVKRRPLTGKRVLEVGMGVGGVAHHLCRTQRCELVGMDLGFAVDVAQRHFDEEPFFHVVQGSTFHPPFADESFDFVYSQGVIHHTHSTRAAFDVLRRLPKPGGRLYVWVYSHYNESRSVVRRAIMNLEKVWRPVCWRLPTKLQTVALWPVLPLYWVHQNLLVTAKDERQVKYGYREALHAARDRFTPRFIWRHTDEEVAEWFSESGFDDVRVASLRPKPDFVPETFVTCVGVEGTRA